MVDHELKKNVIRDVALLKLVGFHPIIVHGGGKEITKWVNKAGLETNFVNGLRVTDKDTMEIAEMVLNKINKGLVSMMEKVGVKAVGISGKDGSLLRVSKKLSKGQDIGYVGEVAEVNTEILDTLIANDFVPVVCPIGSGSDYHSYNVNADDAAWRHRYRHESKQTGLPDGYRGRLPQSAGPHKPYFLPDNLRGRSPSGERKCGRRHAPENPELRGRCESGRWKSTYSGWKNGAQPASRVLYQDRYRYCDHWREGGSS